MLLRRSLPVLLAFAIYACSGVSPETPSGGGGTPDPAPADCNVYGTVSCGGRGLAGVTVSDGVDVVCTDADGKYAFRSGKRHGYVFVSLPSGYEAPLSGIQPRFFKYFTKDAKTAECLDFTLEKVDQTEYSVLFFGDMHLADRRAFDDLGQFRKFADEVNAGLRNSCRRTYAITLGDMAWDIFWSTNNYDLKSYLREMNGSFSGRLPVFHTMGNHDNDPTLAGDFLAETTYKSIIGPTYYSFNIGGTHYVVLDDIEYLDKGDRSFYRDIVAQQVEWLKKDLSFVPKTTPLVLTMHSPLYYNNGDVCLYNGYSSLIQHLKGYNSTFVTGHTHVVYNVDRTRSSVSVYENNSGAVCGAWWVTDSNSGIHLSTDGAPGGYRVMDVSGTAAKSTFKGTGIPQDVQFRSYDRNCICLSADRWVPHATASGKQAFLEAVGDYARQDSGNEVLINVWDYDPSWKIEVRENGKVLPWTMLDDVKDPLYLVCYEAYEYEHHYDTSVYYPASTTDHIFSVKASSANSTLEISVTDRYGRKYVETMTRPKEFSIDNYQY